MSSSLADTTPVHFPQGRGTSLGYLQVILLPPLLPSALALTPKLPEAVLYLKGDSRVYSEISDIGHSKYTNSTAMLHGGIPQKSVMIVLSALKSYH